MYLKLLNHGVFSECSVKNVMRYIMIKFSYSVFSEIMGWEVIVAHQEPSTTKCDGTRGYHARITRRVIVIRATNRMVRQCSIFLSSRNIFQQKFLKTYGIRHTHHSLFSWIPRSLFLLFPVGGNT